MKKTTGITMGVIVAIAVGVMAAFSSSSRPSANNPTATLPATAAASDTRLLPISGDNLDGQLLTFPMDLRGGINLVVMPFNRDQQTNAVNWLATFEQAAANRPDVEYYSIAALEDLSPIIRTLVVQGLNVAVRDEATRQRVVVTFLPNQAEVVAALGEGDISQMRVLIVAQDGRVLWQTSGDYTEQRGAALLEALAQASP